jgi:hypothetical protein
LQLQTFNQGRIAIGRCDHQLRDVKVAVASFVKSKTGHTDELVNGWFSKLATANFGPAESCVNSWFSSAKLATANF